MKNILPQKQKFNKKNCYKTVYQDYNNYAKDITVITPNQCIYNKTLCMQQAQFIQKQYQQQLRYSKMCRQPGKFPLISSSQKINLSPSDQRRYSNMWWRRLGSAQSTPTVSGWPGISINGSDVPYAT
jgi:hypothetical protein